MYACLLVHFEQQLNNENVSNVRQLRCKGIIPKMHGYVFFYCRITQEVPHTAELS